MTDEVKVLFRALGIGVACAAFFGIAIDSNSVLPYVLTLVAVVIYGLGLESSGNE